MTVLKRTVISGARIFDGETPLGTGAVVIEEGVIARVLPGGSGPDDGERVDAAGMTLLPGLIDGHTHVTGAANLEESLRYGVTTELDMFSFPQTLTAKLRAESPDASDRADFRSSGLMAGAKGGWPGAMLPPIPGWEMPGLSGPADAAGFVAARKAEGSDYIKVFVDKAREGGPPTMSAETVIAVCEAAHDQGLKTVAHASSLWAFRTALAAGVTILTHVPLDGVLTEDDVAAIVASGTYLVPTLTMMQAITDVTSTRHLVVDPRLTAGLAPAVVQQLRDGERGMMPKSTSPGVSYDNAAANLALLYRASIPIAVGTDANNLGGQAGAVVHGASQHLELELLVQAGMMAQDVLRGATSLAADVFDLPDRGRIAEGKRADLLLVAGDPLTDITDTRNIERVWRAGIIKD